MSLTLRGFTLIDGTGAPPLTDAALAIDDNGLIAAVGRDREISTATLPTAELNLEGRTLLPGLIDAHVHLVFSAGDDPRSDILAESDDQLFDRAATNAQSLLRAGVTLTRDCGGRGAVTQRLRDAIASGEVVGPRILSSGAPITTPQGHLHFMGLIATGVDGVVEAVRHQVRAGVDFVKVMASGGNMTPGSNPRIAQFSEPELKAMVEEAHHHGRLVAAHVHSTDSIQRAFDAGVDTFEHCSWLTPEGASLDEGLLKQMAKRRAVVSPAVGNTFRTPPEALSPDPSRQAFVREFQKTRFRLGRAMHEAGVPLILGTDAGVRLTRFEDYALAFPIFVERFGLTPMQAIQAATSRAAAAIGVANEVGTIQVGKQADLVVLDGDPLSDLSAFGRIHLVFRRGRRVVEAGSVVHRNVNGQTPGGRR